MLSFRYIAAPNIAQLQSYINALPQKVDALLKESADAIQHEAQANAPVKTGALRSGIVVIRITNGYMVYASVDYSRYQEEGTSRGIRGTRFMYNAMVSEGSNLTGRALSELKF